MCIWNMKVILLKVVSKIEVSIIQDRCALVRKILKLTRQKTYICGAGSLVVRL